jgi:hypothetical protein
MSQQAMPILPFAMLPTFSHHTYATEKRNRINGPYSLQKTLLWLFIAVCGR